MEEYTMTLRPMADNVLLKQNEANETTVGGIILATATKEKPAIYAVVAVGLVLLQQNIVSHGFERHKYSSIEYRLAGLTGSLFTNPVSTRL